MPTIYSNYTYMPPICNLEVTLTKISKCPLFKYHLYPQLLILFSSLIITPQNHHHPSHHPSSPNHHHHHHQISIPIIFSIFCILSYKFPNVLFTNNVSTASHLVLLSVIVILIITLLIIITMIITTIIRSQSRSSSPSSVSSATLVSAPPCSANGRAGIFPPLCTSAL